MKALVLFLIMSVLLIALAIPALTQDATDDPFGGGFKINCSPEIFGMGIQNDSLHGWGFNWASGSGENAVYLSGDGNFPESGQCGNIRDMAAADFNGDGMDETVVAWNRPDGGIFLGIPCIDSVTLAPHFTGWRVPTSSILPGVLYANDSLAEFLGEIRVVTGNFDPDFGKEFVLAYLAYDGTVTLSVFDVDSLSIPEEKGTISDQAVYTLVPPSQRMDKISRFDVTTGDFDGDGFDEIVLLVKSPQNSNGSINVCSYDVVCNYNYDSTSYDVNIVNKSKIPFSIAAQGAGHTCLRRLAVTSGNFDTDSLDEIAIMHRWANPYKDTTRIGNAITLKLNSGMSAIVDSGAVQMPPVPPWVPDNGTNGTNGEIQALIVYDNKLIAGGIFTTAGGVSAKYIAAWAAWDGTTWSPLGSGMNGPVYALTVYDGKLIAGGYFTTAGGVSVNNIAAWDGTTWSPLGTGMNDIVYALTVYDGKLIAGGDFTTAGGISANRIAAWDNTTSAWSPLGSGMNGPVIAFTVHNDKLFAGGAFTTAGGTSANRIAAWDNTTSAWSPLGSGMNGPVFALKFFGGQLIAGGSFTTAGGVSANNIARFNVSIWVPVGTGMNSIVRAFTIYNNNLIAGGYFTTADGVSANHIASWNITTWSPLGSGMDDCCVKALTDYYDGKLIAGGDFTTAGGAIANNIAGWDGASWSAFGLRSELPMDIMAGNIDRNLPGDNIVDELFITSCRQNGDSIEQFVKGYSFDGGTLCQIVDTAVVDGIRSDMNPGDMFSGRRTVALGEVTGDGWTDLTMLLSNNTGAPKIEVFGIYPDTESVCALDSMVFLDALETGLNGLSELVLADMDTMTVTLGPPISFTIDSIVQPLALIYAPPVHYDILNGTTWDISRRYPFPGDPAYNSRVEYIKDEQATLMTETKLHWDWGVSNSVKNWHDYGGFNASNYFDSTYGEGFAKDSSLSKTITVGWDITSNVDQIQYIRYSCRVFEYPIFAGGKKRGDVMVLGPQYTSNTTDPAIDCNNLLPNHEVENILSYPPCNEAGELSYNPLMASGVIGQATDMWTMQQIGSPSVWTLSQALDVTTSVDSSTDYSSTYDTTKGLTFEASASFTFGVDAFKTTLGSSLFHFEIGNETSNGNSYSGGELSTMTTSYHRTDAVKVYFEAINTLGSYADNRKYRVRPYAYWANSGALVIDYAVEPCQNQSKLPPSWWQIHYSVEDPAFILPWRLEKEKLGTTDAERYRYRTREILFVPDNPAPNDTILIAARVHNYSLVPTQGNVKVSFYLGNPAHGLILKDKNSGDSVFYACDTLGNPTVIAPQGSAIAMMHYRVPSNIPACQLIWAVIDPFNEITPEVHDNDDWATNNKGWNELRVKTITGSVCTDSDGDGWYDPDTTCSSCDDYSTGWDDEWDNCPSVPNPDQTDSDGDGIGDACDICPGFNDNANADSDGIPDGCDNCPNDNNLDQLDTDGDLLGDVCDPDDDDDGILDTSDNCPLNYNPLQEDEDEDGIGDACEIAEYICGDASGDQVVNLLDILYLIAYKYNTPPGPAPIPPEAGDANGDGAVNLIDILYLIAYKYNSPPGPEPICP